MSLDISPTQEVGKKRTTDLPLVTHTSAFPRWFTGMAPQTWQKQTSSGRWKDIVMPTLSFFLFVPSWVITINCVMWAVQRWVYRETSTDPSSAFSPSFLEAIAYHIFPALFSQPELKWILPHNQLNVLLPHYHTEDERRLMVNHQQNPKICERKTVQLVLRKIKNIP